MRKLLSFLQYSLSLWILSYMSHVNLISLATRTRTDQELILTNSPWLRDQTRPFFPFGGWLLSIVKRLPRPFQIATYRCPILKTGSFCMPTTRQSTPLTALTCAVFSQLNLLFCTVLLNLRELQIPPDSDSASFPFPVEGPP
jgi:hypothetical protein